jgi:hypothetical protein
MEKEFLIWCKKLSNDMAKPFNDNDFSQNNFIHLSEWALLATYVSGSTQFRMKHIF